ncbi:hypothetical protein CsatB_020704 [Cannabis sativa]
MGSKGPSWDEQWSGGNYSFEGENGEKGGSKKGSGKKMTEVKAVASAGLGKAKVAATVGAEKAKVAAVFGAQKVKSGTSFGIKWVKNQYQKRTSNK